MQKWEYLEVGRYNDLVTAINSKPTDKQPEWHSYIAGLGDQGWELVAVNATGYTSGYYIFKRPK